MNQQETREALDALRVKTTAELSTRLHHLAFEFLEAKKVYEAKRMEQALHQSARELHTDGIWIGDMVQVEDEPGLRYRVQLTPGGHVQLQAVRRGQDIGLPLQLWEVGRITKIEQ